MDIMVPQFAMPTMSGALAAEVRGLPISSRDFGGPWDDMLFSSLPLPNLFQKRFLHLIWVGTVLGHQKSADSIRWKRAGLSNFYLQMNFAR